MSNGNCYVNVKYTSNNRKGGLIMPDLTCKNCDEPIKEQWTTCPACHADLTKGKYKKSDDPVDKLSTRVDKIDQFLTDKFGTPDSKDKKDGKRKTLFGD